MESQEYLKLNDGTILQESKAYETGTGLIVIIHDETIDIVKAFSLLSDSEKANEITYHYYKADLIFNDYTEIQSISKDKAGISAILEKKSTNK